MKKVDIRRMALVILDDDSGISKQVFDALCPILEDADCEDIIAMVDSTEGKFYIGEDYAEEELNNLSKWEEAQNISREESKSIDKQG